MKRPPVFDEVYNTYLQDRGLKDISADLFEQLVRLYPALMVVSSDGFVDLTEANYLTSEATNNNNSIDGVIFGREIKHIYLNGTQWKALFLKLLRAYCELNPIGGDIITSMIKAAGSSTGSVVKNILLSDEMPKININFNEEVFPVDPKRTFLSHKEIIYTEEISEFLGLLSDSVFKTN